MSADWGLTEEDWKRTVLCFAGSSVNEQKTKSLHYPNAANGPQAKSRNEKAILDLIYTLFLIDIILEWTFCRPQAQLPKEAP